jgi:hypothetical protein
MRCDMGVVSAPMAQRLPHPRTPAVLVLAADHTRVCLVTAADINKAYLVRAATAPAYGVQEKMK